jgi:type IV secretion system protein VirB8
VGRDYARLYDGPQARDKTLGSGMEWKVKVLSVTVQADVVGSKATVRFEKTPKRTEAETSDPPRYFIATLSYEYRTSMKGQEKDLIQNPLGFKVTSYRVDAEIGTVSPTIPMAMLERS